MCALTAGRRGRSVAVVDHNEQAGRKILISGGGHCNFTNIYAGPDNYVSQNSHFCKSALARYTPNDFLSFLQRHHVSFCEKKAGQLFCNSSSSAIVDALVGECRQAQVSFVLGCRVLSVQAGGANRFYVTTDSGCIDCRSLVIASGGLAAPQLGATGFGYKLAEQFGLPVIKPEPALDSFRLPSELLEEFASLAGVSLDGTVSVGRSSFQESILITHKGLSGPACLQASLYWRAGAEIVIDLLPALDVEQWLASKAAGGVKAQLKTVLAEQLPKRFAETFSRLYLPAGALAGMSAKSLNEVATRLHSWRIVPAGTVGFKTAEVTRGGIATTAVASRTMEANKVPGLYCTGEVLDVTGWLGGYNLQWAWSSGVAAGEHV